MMFRCPYCGEESFSTLVKMGLVLGKVSSFSTRCPNCQKICARTLVKGGVIGQRISLILIGLLVGLCVWLAAHVKSFAIVTVAIILPIVLYMAFNYFLCYYDKYPKDKGKEKIMIIEMDGGVLWPAIRKGEIYVMVPQRLGNSNNESDYTIAMLRKITKTSKTTKLIFDIIKDPSDSKAELADAVIIRGFGKEFAGEIYEE